jgi:hypothetical protein
MHSALEHKSVAKLIPTVNNMLVRNTLENFTKNHALLIDSVFIKKRQPGCGNKFSIFFYKFTLYLYQSYAMVFLILMEPLLVVSQLQLRGGGGLAGSYQFHRLYEIRKIVKNKCLNSAIEFGSGASTILFTKYLGKFVSIEESHVWRDHCLTKLSILKVIRPSFYRKIEMSITVYDRTEYLDQKNNVVCSYDLPSRILNAQYDLVYIDGPTSWTQNESVVGTVVDPYGYLPNVSLLELKFLPASILIDGRRSTLVHLLRNLENKGYDFLLKGSYSEKPKVNPYHSILTSRN